MRLIYNRLVNDDTHVDQRVASQVTTVNTCFRVRLAVERDTTACANGKRGVALRHVTYRQIQTVENNCSVRLLNRFGVYFRLVRLNTIPYKRQLIRTYSKRVSNRIYLIISEIEHGYGVATVLTRAVEIVDARLVVGLTVPFVGSTCLALDSGITGVRIDDIQGQYHYAVATAGRMESMTINAALRQGLVSKRVLLALTHRMCDIRLWHIVHIQVQYVHNTIVPVILRALGRDIRTAGRIDVSVVAPDIELTRTDRYGLDILVYIQIDIRCDRAVATVDSLIVEFIRTRFIDQTVPIYYREADESNALARCICLIYSQIQDVQRVNLTASRLDRVIINTAVIVGFVMPFVPVALAD